MSEEAQDAALRALRDAHALYRQADAHRTELMELCRRLAIPLGEIELAVGLDRPERTP